MIGREGDWTARAMMKAEPLIGDETNHHLAKNEGIIGISLLMLSNGAELFVHVDGVREFCEKLWGSETLYRFHAALETIFFICVAAGYCLCLYWLWKNLVSRFNKVARSIFIAISIIIFLSAAISLYFMLKAIDYLPLVRSQSETFSKLIVSQQSTGGSDRGGFRFDKKGQSADVQAWTTAQCLVALLQMSEEDVAKNAPLIRVAFDYLDRSKLPDGRGWPYVEKQSWGVTDANAWVALAYLYSLNEQNKKLIWKENAARAVDAVIKILGDLMSRQHETGGWSVIEKTGDETHERTYSTMMSVWALAEASLNTAVLSDQTDEYKRSLSLGVKRLLSYKVTGGDGFSGWWSNPQLKYLPGVVPGLTAQAMFVLTEAKAVVPFIADDTEYKSAIKNYFDFAEYGISERGRQLFSGFANRSIDDNERASDSDRYLNGRNETAEESTFLWYPWAVAFASRLASDQSASEDVRARAKNVLDIVLTRADEDGIFVAKYEEIYPAAEQMFADEVFLNNNQKILNASE